MWKYIKRHLPFAVLAALFMTGEVLMDLLQPKIMSSIVDDGVLGLHNNGMGSQHLILALGLKMVVLVVIGGVCGAFNNVFVHMSSQNIGNDIRKDLFRSIMKLSFQQTDEFSTGSLVTRVTNDVTQSQNMVAQFVRGIIRTVMLTAGSIYFMFRLNTAFGVIILCVLPFILGCLTFCLRSSAPLYTKLQTQLDRVNSIMQEDIAGVRIIKACVRELYEKARFGKANKQLVDTQLTVLVLFAFMTPVMFIFMNIAMIVIIKAGSVQVADGVATPGTIMAAITYTTQLLSGILMLVMLFQNISRGIASWKRVRQALNCQPALVDGAFNGETTVCGKIEFRNVSFAYPGTEKTVLNNINLTVNPGETLAILGATGCGKTALISLIPRFYDVTQGSVLVDGVDVREYRQSALRDKISVALQKSELFSKTISENIAWGSSDGSEENIKIAAKIAQASEFVEAMPYGYNARVSERGTSLSGGQKQRISIARAVIKDSEVLIFDDTTSALDLKTEASLYAALRQFRPDSTKIIVAQRLASVRGANRIIVLDEGNIVGNGNHNELLSSCAVYRDICQSQLGIGGEFNA